MGVDLRQEGVNVFNFVVEPYHPEYFDARKLLTQREFNAAAKELSGNLNTNYFDYPTLEAAIALKRLDRQALVIFMENSSDKLEKIVANMRPYANSANLNLRYLATCREIIPSAYVAAIVAIQKTQFNAPERLRERIEIDLTDPFYENALESLVLFKTAFYWENLGSLRIEQEAQIAQWLELKGEQLVNAKNGNVPAFAKQAAYYSIVSPHNKPFVADFFSQLDIAELFSFLKRTKSYKDLLSLLNSLQIINSQKIEFTEEGMHIVMPPEKRIRQNNDMPAERSF